MQIQKQPKLLAPPVQRFTFAAQPQNNTRNARITFGNLPVTQNMFQNQSNQETASPQTQGNSFANEIAKQEALTNRTTATAIRIQPDSIPILQGQRSPNANVFMTQYPSLTDSQGAVGEKNQNAVAGNYPAITESQDMRKVNARQSNEPMLLLSGAIPVYQINLEALEKYHDSNKITKD
jgi:hypothetical protein